MSGEVVALLIASLVIVGGLAFFAGLQWAKRQNAEATVRAIGTKVKEAAAKTADLRRADADALARKNPTVDEFRRQEQRVKDLLDKKP